MTQMEVCEVRDRNGQLINVPDADEDFGPYGAHGEPAAGSYGPVRRMPRDHFVHQAGDVNDQHDQAHELREPFEELASRLVDLRGIAQPPTFSGMPEDWGEFRFRFEAVAGLLNLDTMLQRIAAQQQNAFLTPSERAQSKLTYNMLVQLVHGKALALLRLVRRHDGVAAWQALLKEYEPAQPARFCATLTQLLRPEWDESKPFMEQLWEWERRVADYEVETGMPMPDTYKCSVVARSSPPGIRAFLRLQTDDVTESFARLKQAIDSYQLRGRTFEYVDSMATVPMDVGAITGDARPYAKGGGKAGGDREVARGSQLHCRRCGKKGHASDECHAPWSSCPGNQGKGKSKGKGKGKWAEPKPKAKAALDGKGASKKFDGTCFNCGRPGHRAADCRQRQCQMVDDGNDNEVTGVDEVQSVDASRMGLSSDVALLMLDSGSFTHVCPRWFAEQYGIEIMEKTEQPPVTADGHELEVYGRRTVHFLVEGDIEQKECFQVMSVRKPILSVNALKVRGAKVWFSKPASWLQFPDGTECALVERGNLTYLPVKVLSSKGKVMSIPPTLEAIVENERPWFLVEWACDAGSGLSAWFERAGHCAQRFHLPHWDSNSSGRVDKVVELLKEAGRRGFHVILWMRPCTAWCRWQTTHASSAARERILGERKYGLETVEQFTQAVHLLHDAGLRPDLAFESPRQALGWQQPSVKKMLKDFGMNFNCQFDGCRYGATDSQGTLTRKPWRIATTVERLMEPLSLRCCEQHEGAPHQHARCRTCTSELANVVGKTITRGDANRGVLPIVAPLFEADVAPVLATTEPTREEREEHSLTHLPFKAWCALCVAAKAADEPHHQLPPALPDETPVVEMDYGFLRSGEETVAQPILAATAKPSGYCFAGAARTKGAGDMNTIAAMCRFLVEAGLTARLRLRTDAEPSIKAVAAAVAAQRAPAETVIETSPVGSSSSIGAVERKIQTLAGQIRVLRLATEQMWNIKLRADAPIFKHLVSYAAWTENRFQPTGRGEVRQTPYASVHGKDYTGVLFRFAQPVLIRVQDISKMAKLDPRWTLGIWIG